MTRSLLEQLPKIVADGRQRAERILASLEGPHRVGLQTREWVLPAKDTAASDWIANALRRANLRDGQAHHWHNRLIHGGDLLALTALLAGAEHTASLRGQVDLIHIGPPSGSKADGRIKIALPRGPSRPSMASGALGLLPDGPSRPSMASGALGLPPSVELVHRRPAFERLACADARSHGTASYLAMITPRLVLMRALLRDTGSICVHLDSTVARYVKIVMDDIFGSDGFERKVVWRIGAICGRASRSAGDEPVRNRGRILYYTKCRNVCLDDDFAAFRQDRVRADADTPVGAGRRIHGPWRRAPMDRTGCLRSPRRSGHNARSDAQHHEHLLARIIQATLTPGALVLDCCGGSGAAAAVAERLGCRWITSDPRELACMVIRKRLIDQDARPFLYQAVGDFPIEAATTATGRDSRAGLRGQMRFTGLQYLTVQPVQRRRNGDQEQLRVTLDNYVPLSPEAIDLDDDDRRKLRKAIDSEPLALIEYWAVDPDYDGEVFRSVWQDYRGNTANDDDPLRVATKARFSVPHRSGARRVCVRMVDVFGFEAEVVQWVPEAGA